MITLEQLDYLTTKRPLIAGFPISASITDDVFAQGIELLVKTTEALTLFVTQRSYVLASHFCTTSHKLAANRTHKLLLPKLSGLAAIELLADADCKLVSGYYVKLPSNAVATTALVPSDVNITYWKDGNRFVRTAKELELVWSELGSFTLQAQTMAKGNEAYLTELASPYLDLEVKLPWGDLLFCGSVVSILQTNYYHAHITNNVLKNRQASIAVTRVTTAVAASSIFTSQQVIHVQ